MVTSQTETNGAQSAVKTMDVLGNLTAAVTVVMLGNHLETAIQHLHIGNSKIRAHCLRKSQAKVQLNCLNCQELIWVESNALTDAAFGEGGAGVPLGAKQLQKFFLCLCSTV